MDDPVYRLLQAQVRLVLAEYWRQSLLRLWEALPSTVVEVQVTYRWQRSQGNADGTVVLVNGQQAEGALRNYVLLFTVAYVETVLTAPLEAASEAVGLEICGQEQTLTLRLRRPTEPAAEGLEALGQLLVRCARELWPYLDEHRRLRLGEQLFSGSP